jgi:hypothetical protein
MNEHTHHLFHKRKWLLYWLSGETIQILTYILGIAFITCMFAVMATEWDLFKVLISSCAAFSLLSVLVSLMVRDSFETFMVEKLRYFKKDQDGYAPIRSTLMPRITPEDIVRFH